MAQTNYTPISLYYSTTAAAVPLNTNLVNGELALNITDGKLYYKDNTGTVQLLASKAAAGGVTSITFGSTGLTPSTATSGAVTVGGTLATTNGGTGLTAFTANQVFYASSTSAIAQSTNLQFNGTTLTLANDASIHGLTVGQGLTATGDCVAVGQGALSANTGTGNTGVGKWSLLNNTSGGSNASLGVSSLAQNTTGSFNTSVGAAALFTNNGSNNSAFGTNALYYNSSGANNTAIGYQALTGNSTADNNTAVGYQAGYSATTSANNAFFGYQAGYSANTLGGNSFYGFSAGSSTTGYQNTFVGYSSGTLVTTGNQNTILGGYQGNQGGLDIRTASNYIVLSDGAGNPALYCSDTTNGIWYLNGQSGGTQSGSVVFASNGSAKSAMYYFNSSSSIFVVNNTNGVYLTQNATSWTSTSDERLKTDLLPIEDAVNKINQLRSVTGRFKTDEIGTSRAFLIAQDVQAVFPEAANVQNDEIGTIGVQYTDTIPLLVAAIKELSAKNDALEARLAVLEAK